MDIGSIIIGTSILMAVVLFYALASKFLVRQAHRDERDSKMKDFQLQMEKERHDNERQLREQELEYKKEVEEARRDTGGYIFIDLAERHRSAFLDLLKGFEDYARLRGYRVKFSFDSSIPNKVAFKFTIHEGGIAVSPEQVKKDLDEYLHKVRSGSPLDDLPVLLSPEDHDLLLTTLKNRINFLSHTLKLADNSISYYEALLYRSPWQRSMIESSPAVIVQTGGQMDSRSYCALGPGNVVQGDSNRDLILESDNSIHIADSFNERRSQIDVVRHVVDLLKSVDEHAGEGRDKAIRCYENVVEEMSEQAHPDKSRIQRWLSAAKDSLKSIALGKDFVDAARKLYDAFNLGGFQ